MPANIPRVRDNSRRVRTLTTRSKSAAFLDATPFCIDSVETLRFLSVLVSCEARCGLEQIFTPRE
jgi:hypothetical protein